MTELSSYVKQFDEFLEATDHQRAKSRVVRDYLDNNHWTSEEARILKTRGQAPVVKNIMRRKHDTLLGVERQRRTDPKALPRTPKHEDDASAATKAIRYVLDNTDFDQVASDVFDEVLGEGYAGAITEIKKNKRNEVEIEITRLHWDRVYYDPYSRRRDFKDASFMGVTAWVAQSKLEALYPDHKQDIKSLVEHNTDIDFEDRPRWIDRKSTDPRFRINQHYFEKDDEWWVVYFTQGLDLEEAKPSPFKDEYGESINPMELECSYVGRNNERYGLDSMMIGPQDEVNHRTSKALHMLSNVTIVSEKGAVESATKTLNDLSVGKAFVELLNPDARFEVDRGNAELAQGQLLMLQEAKEYLNDFGPNEVISGKEDRAMSGRALLQRQQAGLTELTHIFDSHSNFKVRIFRQVWNRIRQFWTDERWFRVTDDDKGSKFVALNRRMSEREKLAKAAGVGEDGLDQFMQENGIEAVGDLNQPSDLIENQVSEMDVDIILTEAPDIAILRDEQFEIIARLAETRPEIPVEAIIKSSSITDKDEVLELIQGDEDQRKKAAEQQQEQQALAVEQEVKSQDAESASKLAKARKDNADADGQLLENQIVQMEIGL